jgi:uncharacterized protein YjiS (DUF1127 family)
MNIFRRYFNYLKTWRDHRDVIKQLNKLSNAQLKDIGLNRGEIDDMIWLKEDEQNSGVLRIKPWKVS